jgi:putative membrane protein
VDPLQLAPLAIVAVMYGVRVRTLDQRGQAPRRLRLASYAAGIAVFALAILPPIEQLGKELFLFHMLQHVLLGDLAPLLVVLGLTGPVLRPVLAVRTLDRLRVLAHPLVALPLWALNLYVWHIPALYEAAVRHSAVHALEHLTFFTAGALMWAAVVEVLPGPEWFGTGWKLGYVVVVRALETVLANVFLWSGTVFYGVYVRETQRWGISPLEDQGHAGTIMMAEGGAVTLAALAWLFLRLAREGELRQQLLEEGVDPRAARRAVRYGRGEDLRPAR